MSLVLWWTLALSALTVLQCHGDSEGLLAAAERVETAKENGKTCDGKR